MIPVVVEGDGEVPIVQRLLDEVGLEMGTVYGLRGKDWLDKNVEKYNQAAQRGRWLVLRDLNGDAGCAPAYLSTALPQPSAGMCFRIAVRSSETWLLADRESIAAFLGVPTSRIPQNPETLADPKGEMIRIARQSRRRAIRDDMVPRRGTSSRVGPGYTARIMQFAGDTWQPRRAAVVSNSLARCISALEAWAVTPP